MATTEIFETTLHLRWGPDSSREIEVPVEYRKGSYSGRYELHVDGTHVGWTHRNDYGSNRGLWSAYAVTTQLGLNDDFSGQQVGLGRSRREATDELVYHLGRHARVNVLSERADRAYADNPIN